MRDAAGSNEDADNNQQEQEAQSYRIDSFVSFMERTKGRVEALQSEAQANATPNEHAGQEKICDANNSGRLYRR